MTALPAISKPARRALEGAGVTQLEQLAEWSRAEVLALHGVGPKAITLLEPVMAEHGLAFRQAGKPRKTPLSP